jgi:hypothetical protein
LSLWKYSFELINKELEVTRKKREALDNLFAERKISQSTYDYLKSELAKAISELENNLKKLKERMATRVQELESQLSSLELLLASLEIHHAAGDVSDETYEKENRAILLGLEATKRELNDIRSSLEGPATEPETEEQAAEEELGAEAPEEPTVEEETPTVSYEETHEEPLDEGQEFSPEASAEPKVEEGSSAYYSDESSSGSSWETEQSTDY